MQQELDLYNKTPLDRWPTQKNLMAKNLSDSGRLEENSKEFTMNHLRRDSTLAKPLQGITEAPEEEMQQQDYLDVVLSKAAKRRQQQISQEVDSGAKLNFKMGIEKVLSRKTTKGNLEGLRKNLSRILEGTKDISAILEGHKALKSSSKFGSNQMITPDEGERFAPYVPAHARQPRGLAG